MDKFQIMKWAIVLYVFILMAGIALLFASSYMHDRRQRADNIIISHPTPTIIPLPEGWRNP
jgi:hypothetical protein